MTRSVHDLVAAALGEPTPGWEGVHIAESALLTDWLTVAATTQRMDPQALAGEDVRAVVGIVSGRRHGLPDGSRHHALLDALQAVCGPLPVLRTVLRAHIVRLLRQVADVARTTRGREADRALLSLASATLTGVEVALEVGPDTFADITPTLAKALDDADGHMSSARAQLDTVRALIPS